MTGELDQEKVTKQYAEFKETIRPILQNNTEELLEAMVDAFEEAETSSVRFVFDKKKDAYQVISKQTDKRLGYLKIDDTLLRISLRDADDVNKIISLSKLSGKGCGDFVTALKVTSTALELIARVGHGLSLADMDAYARLCLINGKVGQGCGRSLL